LLNVNNISKQGVQNKTLVTGVKLNARIVLLSHTGYLHTDICAIIINVYHLSSTSSMTLHLKRCQTSIKHCFSSSTSLTC